MWPINGVVICLEQNKCIAYQAGVSEEAILRIKKLFELTILHDNLETPLLHRPTI